MIGNLPPRLRSSLKTIQLIVAVTSDNLNKYGFEKVLERFIDDANKLSQVSKFL